MNAGSPPSVANGARGRRETRILLILWVTGVGALSVFLSGWISASRPENLHYVWIAALALATVPGKLAIFGGLAADSPLDPWGVAALSVAVDGLLSVSLSLGLTPILRIPGIGTWLRGANARAASVLTGYPRLKRTAFWGAALFVALPLPGSGWVGGTFAAQLLGLTRPMGVAAIVIGSCVVSAGFAGLAVALGREAESIVRSPWTVLAGLVVALLCARFIWHRFRDQLRAGP